MARRLLVLVIALAVAVAACTATPTPEQLKALTDIDDVEQLASDFNEHAGSPRLILLLSPT